MQTGMLERLTELGLREEGEERELHSGLKSNVFWDIEALFAYPSFIITKAIELFIWELGKLKPEQLIGIPTGGLLLGQHIRPLLRLPMNILVCHDPESHIRSRPCIMIDDVLTTGDTLARTINAMMDMHGTRGLGWRPNYIAVLVNRGGITEIEGIPVISGIMADKVIRE